MAFSLLPIEIIQNILNISTGMKFKCVLDELKSRNGVKMTKMLEYAKEFDLEEIFIEKIPIIGYIGDFSSLFRTLVDGLGADYSSLGDIQNEFQSIQNGLETLLSLSLSERIHLNHLISRECIDSYYSSINYFSSNIDNNRKNHNETDNFQTFSSIHYSLWNLICSTGDLNEKLMKYWISHIVTYHESFGLLYFIK